MTSPPVIAALAIGYFPADEWPRAIARWPGLLEEMPAEHRAYCEAIEARTKRLARRFVGQRFALTPLTVDALESRAAEAAGSAHEAVSGADEADGDATPAQVRSFVAADQWRQGVGTPWPPGRNDRCWCGSGRKYKQCCGPVPAAPDAAPPETASEPRDDSGPSPAVASPPSALDDGDR